MNAAESCFDPTLRERLSAHHPRAGLEERFAITRPLRMNTEKLTETIAVKVCDTTLRQLKGVSEAASTTVPELVRYLIEKHLETERERFRALHSIFGNE